ncbi:unnamed protein product [Citrullus colocynthis]|uniref:Uncharacterized protein n=1 Tax=Citrullus colocynthis TaxID=252529 RepID=A0ABP0Y8N7_9ROSI
MALHQIFTSFQTSSFIERVSFNLNPLCVSRTIKAIGAANMCKQTIVRRSGNYQPPIWKHEFIQALRSEFVGEIYVGKLNELKGEIGVMMNNIISEVE